MSVSPSITSLHYIPRLLTPCSPSSSLIPLMPHISADRVYLTRVYLVYLTHPTHVMSHISAGHVLWHLLRPTGSGPSRTPTTPSSLRPSRDPSVIPSSRHPAIPAPVILFTSQVIPSSRHQSRHTFAPPSLSPPGPGDTGPSPALPLRPSLPPRPSLDPLCLGFRLGSDRDADARPPLSSASLSLPHPARTCGYAAAALCLHQSAHGGWLPHSGGRFSVSARRGYSEYPRILRYLVLSVLHWAGGFSVPTAGGY